ncbi:MAG: hypothetical protein KDC92_14565 [Bacteroidetes bacterium]|nr:hypothetical protein [Bacteroidota bacterium]
MISTLFMAVACNNNNCAQFDCVNGECERGVCVCDEGYEGTRCNISWSSKMSGSYLGRDCYDSEDANYTITSFAKDSITFNNFFKAGITEGSKISIPNQEIEQEGIIFSVSGSGRFSGDTMWLQYTSVYPEFPTFCELILVKQ